jgi:predicted dehydrogenase
MTLGVGILGHGFMGRTHEAAWIEADSLGAECEVRAIAAGSAEVAGVLADPRIDLVSICTPTDTHHALAVAALEAGRHVLLEKPVALQAQDIDAIAAVARQAGLLCMPAHCMRFWPGWPELREMVLQQTYGLVKSAVFRRVGHPPDWNTSFYGDPARSGGALFDLHIHDADFVLWTFGTPSRLESTGTRDHVTTRYSYDGFDVHAEGGWVADNAAAFEMSYTVHFERASVDFSLERTPQMVVSSAAGTLAPVLSSVSAYTAQALHFAAAVAQARAGGRPSMRVTLEDARAVTVLLTEEMEGLGLQNSR